MTVEGDTIRLLIDGLLVTVALTVVTCALALIVGIAAAVVRISPTPLRRRAAALWIEVFRNVPPLIQVLFWAFAVPSAFSPDVRRSVFFDNGLWDLAAAITNVPLPYYALAAIVALVSNTGAHIADIIRTGFGATAVQHLDSARTLGAGRFSALRLIVLPNAIRVSFPALTTRLIHNMKNTALVSFVAVPDLFHAMQAGITDTFRATELLAIAALMYLGIATLMSIGLGHIDKRLLRGRSRVRPA